MARLDWRYRLLGRIPWFNPDHTKMTAADRERARRRRPSLLLTGRPDRGVATRFVDESRLGERVRIRVDEPVTPATSIRPLIVYIHGGAWMFGDMNSPAWLTTHLASAADAVVVSIEYRLAPEYAFPAGLTDCWTTLNWIVDHALALGADAERLAIMGDSAGGNLSAVLCLMARDHGGPSISHQTLVYAPLDLSWASPSIDSEGRHRMLDRVQLDAVREGYIGEADPTDWRISPLHADDLRGLPPAHILVAEHDTLRDDGIRYAERLRAHGVPVRLDNYTGMAHAFLALSLFPTMRRQALADMVVELKAAFSDR